MRDVATIIQPGTLVEAYTRLWPLHVRDGQLHQRDLERRRDGYRAGCTLRSDGSTLESLKKVGGWPVHRTGNRVYYKHRGAIELTDAEWRENESGRTQVGRRLPLDGGEHRW